MSSSPHQTADVKKAVINAKSWRQNRKKTCSWRRGSLRAIMYALDGSKTNVKYVVVDGHVTESFTAIMRAIEYYRPT